MNTLFFILLFAPLSIFAMQPSGQKEYYELVMGSLILLDETTTINGSEIHGTFRKGDHVSCRKNANGKTEAQFITKKGDTIDPEILGESPDHLYECLSKRASLNALIKAQNNNK